MTLHVPQFLQSQSGDADITYSGFEMRNLLESVNRKDNGFAAERGVLAGSGSGFGFKVSQRGSGANFSVDVASGRAIINDGEVTNGGVAFVWSDATFNLATPSPPASGTNLHRVVLQLRNKLENGTYTTYDFIPVLVADTSSGGSGTFPAEPTSAITLAQVSIASGQANVSNSNITDYREGAGPSAAFKPSDTGRTSASMTNDPDLQLLNLASSATYKVSGLLIYNAANGTDISLTWSVPAGSVFRYTAARIDLNSNTPVHQVFAASDTLNAQGNGTGTGTGVSGQVRGITVNGTLTTVGAPQSLVLQWGANTNTGSTTTLMARSHMQAVRLI